MRWWRARCRVQSQQTRVCAYQLTWQAPATSATVQSGIATENRSENGEKLCKCGGVTPGFAVRPPEPTQPICAKQVLGEPRRVWADADPDQRIWCVEAVCTMVRDVLLLYSLRNGVSAGRLEWTGGRACQACAAGNHRTRLWHTRRRHTRNLNLEAMATHCRVSVRAHADGSWQLAAGRSRRGRGAEMRQSRHCRPPRG